jgi:hypothetical protein
VEPRGEASVDLTLSEGGFVTGRLLDAEARPLRGRVRVVAVDGHNLSPFVHDLVQIEAGPDGRFVLGPVPTGEIAIEAASPGFAKRETAVTIGARSRDGDVGDVVLDAGGSRRPRPPGRGSRARPSPPRLEAVLDWPARRRSVRRLLRGRGLPPGLVNCARGRLAAPASGRRWRRRGVISLARRRSSASSWTAAPGRGGCAGDGAVGADGGGRRASFAMGR